MHELIAELTKMLNLTPEQMFRVSAMIKRYVHDEKASVFSRYAMYGQGAPIFDRTDPENPKVIGHEEPKNKWLHDIMKAKAEQHAEWAQLPDEEVITWSVGSFKYVQKVDPCCVCGEELTGKSHTSTGRWVNDAYECKTYCPEHAPKDKE